MLPAPFGSFNQHDQCSIHRSSHNLPFTSAMTRIFENANMFVLIPSSSEPIGSCRSPGRKGVIDHSRTKVGRLVCYTRVVRLDRKLFVTSPLIGLYSQNAPRLCNENESRGTSKTQEIVEARRHDTEASRSSRSRVYRKMLYRAVEASSNLNKQLCCELNQ